MALIESLIIELVGDKSHPITLLGSLIIQFKFEIFMMLFILLRARIANKTVREFMMLDTYTQEHRWMLFGFLFVFWFGVITYYRYIFQLPLMGVIGYLW